MLLGNWNLMNTPDFQWWRSSNHGVSVEKNHMMDSLIGYKLHMTLPTESIILVGPRPFFIALHVLSPSKKPWSLMTSQGSTPAGRWIMWKGKWDYAYQKWEKIMEAWSSLGRLWWNHEQQALILIQFLVQRSSNLTCVCFFKMFILADFTILCSNRLGSAQ